MDRFAYRPVKRPHPKVAAREETSPEVRHDESILPQLSRCGELHPLRKPQRRRFPERVQAEPPWLVSILRPSLELPGFGNFGEGQKVAAQNHFSAIWWLRRPLG